MFIKSIAIIASVLLLGLAGCSTSSEKGSDNVTVERSVRLTNGVDASAGGDQAYIISIRNATFYLEKSGGGLSSMLDNDGVDWLGFHKEKGSGHKGEYRGFPNAIHRQDGNYFHAMNAGTDPSSSVVEVETEDHVRIVFTSENGKWEGRWDFYPDRCDFTMTKISAGYKYWVQYEGVPGGQMDRSDFRYSSGDPGRHLIDVEFIGDLPEHEWMAFGDANSPRMVYVLHHQNDEHPDDYVSRPDMTVLGFGRRNKDKFLTTPQSFSIGFVETTLYTQVKSEIETILQ